MSSPEQLLFLPGASGNKAFWQPLAALLDTAAARRNRQGHGRLSGRSSRFNQNQQKIH
jgi:hypothetical protein